MREAVGTKTSTEADGHADVLLNRQQKVSGEPLAIAGYPPKVRAWSLAEPAEYMQLKLRGHELLADVHLPDVWQVELPGGGPDRTIADVRSLMSASNLTRVNPIVRALFRLRLLLGRLFRWDSSIRNPMTNSFLSRLSEQDRMRSLIEPGVADGPFTVLYVHPREAVSEIRNATVHAFSVLALEERASGYCLFWAIYAGWGKKTGPNPTDRAKVRYQAFPAYGWRRRAPGAGRGRGQRA